MPESHSTDEPRQPTKADARRYHQTARDTRNVTVETETYKRITYAHQAINAAVKESFDPGRPQHTSMVTVADTARLLLTLAEQADLEDLDGPEARLCRALQDALCSYSEAELEDRSQPKYRNCPECGREIRKEEWQKHHQECIVEKYEEVDEA